MTYKFGHDEPDDATAQRNEWWEFVADYGYDDVPDYILDAFGTAKNLRARLAKLEEDLDKLSTTVSSLSDNVTTLGNDVTTLKGYHAATT